MSLMRRLSPDQMRSARHWVMEFVVVVAGVLLALWLQEWTQRRRAVEDMRAAEDAIHNEVRTALEDLVWRQVISRCHFERAERLKTMLLNTSGRWPGLNENALLQNSLNQATGVETVVPSIYPRPAEPFVTAAWNSALTTGALEPMDRQRFVKLTGIYAQLQLLAANREREDRAASILSALAFPQELTPDARTRMLSALYEIDSSRFMFTFAGASDLARRMRELGWNDRQEIDHWIAQDKANDRERGFRWRSCVQPYINPFRKN